MLTKELGIYEFDFRNFQLIPDRLTTGRHSHYVALAEKMVEVYRNGAGLRRRDLHRRIRNLFDEVSDCPSRRIDAFCKLLDESAVFDDSGRKTAPKLRQKVFSRAAEFHPLVSMADSLFETAVGDVRSKISKELGQSWDEIEERLFADVLEYHKLTSFDGFADPRTLLSRYNLAQVQVALFSAVSMELRITKNFKQILRAIRLAQLMHTITRVSDGVFDVRIDGPASVLRETRRYGVQMAKLLPVLVATDGWAFHAQLVINKRIHLSLRLQDKDGLRSPISPEDEFDSSVEQNFAEKWGEESRDGWTLSREADFLIAGQKTFVPDFLFRHTSGQKVFMEIVGFWTPEYLEARRRTLETFADTPIILAVHESTVEQLGLLPAQHRIISYKTAINLKLIQETLASLLKSDP